MKMSSSSCSSSRRPRATNNITITTLSTIYTLLLLTATVPQSRSHGYLSSPRSRNYVAFQDRQWSLEDALGSLTPVPWPEDCPHCLNRGGVLAQCGLLTVLDTEGKPVTRNYDIPMNYKGEPMPPNIQATYTEGDVIDVEVMVTTHHKGHFVFSACPIVPSAVGYGVLHDVPPNQVPDEDCFKRYKLTLVEDTLFNANIDKRFPERVYIAPASNAEWKNEGPEVQPVSGAKYKYKLQLPEGLHGEMVLLQWYYLTANSCKHVGYDMYDWPEEWGKDVELYGALPDCENVPEDGDGVPEQFWNCAEVKINPKKIEQASSSSTNTFEQCADTSYSYYEATEDCSGYVYCMAGGSIDGPYECGSGQKYDTDTQRCNWEDEVTSCGSAAEPGVPTVKPTPKPTALNTLLDWEEVPRPHDKVIIGYYASWQWYDRDGLAAPINMDFHKITRANFAFFQITKEGEIYGTDSWADPITLFGPYDWMAEDGFQYCSWDGPGEPPKCGYHHYQEGLIYLAHQAGAEVYPSIGGWTLSDPFPPMSANPVARKHFAKRCVELIENYNFDGIDLDWEYPGYADHSGTPDDTVNFNLLLDDVRAALDELGEETGRFYGLTAALPCGPSLIGNQDVAHVSSVLTELNLMTYDLHGAWNPETGVNAPLYDQQNSPELSVDGCVKNWEAGGAPPEKINIGFPFYGRSFIGATGLYQPHEGVDDATWHADEGVPQYYNIYSLLSTMIDERDEQTMTQIAYFHTGNMVSYDDERAICDKTEYAMDNGHLGYIIWELSGDLLEDGTTPLLDAANRKLEDPSIDCANMGNGGVASYESSDPNAGDGEVLQERTKFYPHYDSSTCLSDGLQPAWLQTSDIFDNVKDCCRSTFPWNTDCVAQSTPLGVVFYPHHDSSTCLSDGKHPDWLPTSEQFSSLKDCCGTAFKFNKDCVAQSTPMSVVFYPHHDSSTCLFDGKHPDWLPTSEKFSSLKDCCGTAFPYNKDCEKQSTPIKGEVFYPASGTYKCLSDGKQPPYMSKDSLFNNEKDCCLKHFTWVDLEVCLANGKETTTSTTTSSTTATTKWTSTSTTSTKATTVATQASTTSTTRTTATSTKATTVATQASTTSTTRTTTSSTKGSTTAAKSTEVTPTQPARPNAQSTLFYPLFEEGITTCQNDGNRPRWMRKKDLKKTLSECCQAYASDYDDCMAVSSESNERFFPDFQTMSCVNERYVSPEDWMSDSYFRWNRRRCCKEFFASAESSSCSGIL